MKTISLVLAAIIFGASPGAVKGATCHGSINPDFLDTVRTGGADIPDSGINSAVLKVEGGSMGRISLPSDFPGVAVVSSGTRPSAEEAESLLGDTNRQKWSLAMKPDESSDSHTDAPKKPPLSDLVLSGLCLVLILKLKRHIRPPSQ